MSWAHSFLGGLDGIIALGQYGGVKKTIGVQPHDHHTVDRSVCLGSVGIRKVPRDKGSSTVLQQDPAG